MRKENLNFIFWGTPEVAAETLEILKTGGYLPALVVTAPDRPQGRGMRLAPPPVKVWADKNGIPCLQPEKLDEALCKSLMLKMSRTPFDINVVVAYGKIIPEDILNLPKLGSINVHYSLLPKYRGASPVESAILNNETETGVTVQKMAYKMDAGDILTQEKTAIFQNETAPDLRKRLTKIGGELLVKILPDFAEGKIKPVAQNESQATYCRKIKKEDGLVDLVNETPNTLYNKFRAYANWPRLHFFQEGKRIIITGAKLENGKFIIKKVVPEGEKESEYENFMKT